MRKNEWLNAKIDELEDEAFIEVADHLTDRVAAVVVNDQIIHMRDLEGELKEVRSERGKFKGFSTGYQGLDNKMGGLEKGSVILIGGETSNGKSAVAANIACNIASQNTGVLYISLEMTRKQMLERFDVITEGYPMGMNLSLQKHFALNYKDVKPLLERARDEFGAEVVVLDYLQYLGRGMSLDEVARMSKEIKSLALEFNVAFLVIVSIRKGSAEAKFRRKWMDIEIEDFMGSGAIGYDCDTAILVSRKDPEGDFQKEYIYIKVLKTRNSFLDWNDRVVTMRWDQTRISEEWISPVFPVRESA